MNFSDVFLQQECWKYQHCFFEISLFQLKASEQCVSSFHDIITIIWTDLFIYLWINWFVSIHYQLFFLFFFHQTLFFSLWWWQMKWTNFWFFLFDLIWFASSWFDAIWLAWFCLDFIHFFIILDDFFHHLLVFHYHLEVISHVVFPAFLEWLTKEKEI